MSDLPAQLSLEAARRIDEICDAFEVAWRAGERPRIEDYLPQSGDPQTARPALLQALLKVELELLRASGGQPSRDEYLARFAADVETVRAVLDDAPTEEQPPDAAGKLSGSAATGAFAGNAADVPDVFDDRTRGADTQATVGGQIETATGQPGAPGASPAEAPGGPAMPERLGRYQIIRALGQGAMGAVYLAHDTQLDRQVALKIPKFPEGAGGEVLDRFYREARSAAVLRHPNICPVYDVGEIGGRHTIAMAYIEGESLKDALAAGPLPQRTAAEWVRKLALALGEAHRRGIIHRDLKPANVMIDHRGEPVVMDFGLARRVEGGDDRVTHTGHILGTPAYMSPEQVEGDPQRIGPPADIYSLGVILYELLTGRLPFQGSLMAILRQIAVDEPPPPSSLRSDVDPRLETICRRMMAKRIEERYGSMDEVAAALAEVLDARANEATVGVGLEQRPLRTADTAVAPGDSFRRAGGVGPRVRGAGRRRWAVAAALSGALAILLGVILYVQLGKVVVRIELLDPTITVRVDDQQEALVFEGEGAPIRLRPGPHDLIVERDGLTTLTQQFTVNRGDDLVLRVTRVGDRLFVLAPGQPLPAGADESPEESTVAGAWHGWPGNAPPPAIAPFDAPQARAHQEAWAAYLGVPVEYENSIGMKFVLIPPGEFLMGSPDEEIVAALAEIGQADARWHEHIASEAPRRRVALTQAFYLGQHEVTQQQYAALTGTNPSYFAGTGQHTALVAGVDTSQFPVEIVSWQDAAGFCAELSQTEGLAPFYARAGLTVSFLDGMGYRMPTEAEWEFACRAGTTTRHWSGDALEDAERVAWLGTNSAGQTHPVGERDANPFGLYDVHGNVWEWVQDWWGPFAVSTTGDIVVDPKGATSGNAPRVVRGGAWDRPWLHSRSGSRFSHRGGERWYNLGVRVVLSVDGVRQALSASRQATLAAAAHEWPADAPPPAIAPFDTEQAQAHQRAWADYLSVPVEYENSIGMKFVLVPPGEFLMGSSATEIAEALEHAGEGRFWRDRMPSEGPRHRVILPQARYLGVAEVTQSQFAEVMDHNPSRFAATGEDPELSARVAGLSTVEHPVDSTIWSEAAEFCARLSERENLKSAAAELAPNLSLEAEGYRLPTEAEWEFACRAGTTTKFWTGDDPEALPEAAWCRTNSADHTHAVGALAPNPFGLCDMHGNAWEWCLDWWQPNYYASFLGEAALNPGGPETGSVHAARGGGWVDAPALCRAAIRSSTDGTARNGQVGFRVSLSVDAVRRAVVPPRAIAPFDAEQAKAHQQAWADHLGVPVEYENSLDMKFVLIPPGEFLMGSPASDADADKVEQAQAPASVETPCYLGVHEVTVAQFRAFDEAENVTTEAEQGAGSWGFSPASRRFERVPAYTWREPGYVQADDHPVTCVSWSEAVRFCDWLSRRDSIQHRLPSELEWEFACRAGTQLRFGTGDAVDTVRGQGNVADQSLQRIWGQYPRIWPYGPCEAWDDGYPFTAPAGKFPANGFGLHDTIGNVREFCGENAPVFRGGSFSNPAVIQRATARFPDRSMPDFAIGFRIALSVDDVRNALHNAGRPVVSGAPSQVVDLLKLVDVDRDAVHGKWTLTEKGLASDGGVAYCRLKLPYAPPAEYDFRIEFTAQGGNDILQLLTSGEREFTWLMGAWGGKYDGLDTVRGHPLTREGTNIIGRATAVGRGQRHTSAVEVRRDSIAASIDGELVVRYTTDGSDLGIPPQWSIGEGAIGLGTTFDAVVFHRIEIVVPAAASAQ